MACTYRFTVLGCRVNHAERRDMETVLRSRGLRKSESSADIEVVHTCSVTGTAAAKSRNAIRRASRRGGRVIVTGCFPGTDGGVAAELGDAVVPQAGEGVMIDRFAETLDAMLDQPRATGVVVRRAVTLPVTMPKQPAHHVRAELRIQDGCDAHCTFCIIPKIRTTLRSKKIGDVVAEATRLVDLGHQEIVLTGIFIGAYGHETALRRKQVDPDREHLADLLDAVAQIKGLGRLRLSSMEPGDVTNVLLDAMLANQPIIAPHLHLPLQSGSDAVLHKMNRQYDTDMYLDMIAMVQDRLTLDALPPAITTDIICGFPSEDENDFDRTIEIAQRVGFLHMHVFPYSVRSGTAAARWPQLPASVIRHRVQTLLSLDSELSLSYRRNLVDHEVRVLIEHPANGTEYARGRCDHYAEITLATNALPGTLVAARVTHATATTTPAVTVLPVLQQQAVTLTSQR
ncbi:MAG: MiaB/RimO family radical SAM methylthiotransferase [Phycisphaerales bacterium]|nr:MiaB/RimO family radical SAM methylthiotransferase [Phycisphaerales bacterium]